MVLMNYRISGSYLAKDTMKIDTREVVTMATSLFVPYDIKTRLLFTTLELSLIFSF